MLSRVARLLAAGVLFAPLAGLVPTLFGPAAGAEWARVGGLFGTTATLAALAAAVAVPGGVLVGLALARAEFPGRSLAVALTLLGLATPLPVAAVAWQVVLGNVLPIGFTPLSAAPGDPVAFRPWGQGLLPAALVHGCAGLPWVAAITWAALALTDPLLEERARLDGGGRRVFARVLGPRLLGAAAVGAAWVAAQAFTEIAVTDAMMVRTFAEEVYTQFVSDAGGVPGAVRATLPAWLGGAAAAAGLALVLGRRIGAGGTLGAVRASGRAWWGVAAWPVLAAAVGVPLLALVWKAGGGANPAGFAGSVLLAELRKVAATDGAVLAESLFVALATGVDAAALAGVFAGRFRRSPRSVVVPAVVLALTPGPLVGWGLKRVIAWLLGVEDAALSAFSPRLTFPPLRSALYDQPSPLPTMWANAARWSPLALLVLGPALARVPQSLWDRARLDGLGGWGTFRRVAWPQARLAWVGAALLVAALTLGEVSASKLVDPPFRQSAILRLFSQMHYGAESTVAALALLQTGAAATLLALAGLALKDTKR